MVKSEVRRLFFVLCELVDSLDGFEHPAAVAAVAEFERVTGWSYLRCTQDAYVSGACDACVSGACDAEA